MFGGCLQYLGGVILPLGLILGTCSRLCCSPSTQAGEKSRHPSSWVDDLVGHLPGDHQCPMLSCFLLGLGAFWGSAGSCCLRGSLQAEGEGAAPQHPQPPRQELTLA